jgi:hypothetical protein
MAAFDCWGWGCRCSSNPLPRSFNFQLEEEEAAGSKKLLSKYDEKEEEDLLTLDGSGESLFLKFGKMAVACLNGAPRTGCGICSAFLNQVVSITPSLSPHQRGGECASPDEGAPVALKWALMNNDSKTNFHFQEFELPDFAKKKSESASTLFITGAHWTHPMGKRGREEEEAQHTEEEAHSGARRRSDGYSPPKRKR